jgi:DNA-binding SARP family transcriptional activator
MPGRTCRREQAIDLLWSDVEPERARHALRQTIWDLRRRVDDSIIIATRESLSIGIEIRQDRTAFLAAVHEARFEDAVALYRGDFLPNLALPGGVDFEHWADLERGQLRMAYLHAARSLTRAWMAESRHRDSIALARQLRDAGGTEADWRLLLESLVAARDTLGAELEAAALERSLGTEAGAIEPSTRALIRAARLGTTLDAEERGRDAGLVAELVGREAEFAALMSGWDVARNRRLVVARVSAMAGLGKTRLLNDFTARLRAIRGRVVVVRARAADRAIPFAHAADIAAAIAPMKGAAGISPANATALVNLNPSLSSVFSGAGAPRGEADAFLHRVLALHELITLVADEGPIAILLDDHHWADAESRRLVAAVLSRLDQIGVMIVIASRPGYSEPAIQDAQRIELQPLSGANMTAMIGSIAELPREEWAVSFCDLIRDVTGGSPLLVLETLHSLMERNLLAIEDGKWRTSSAADLLATRSASNAIGLRVRSSSMDERNVLAVLALAGTPAPAPLVAAATGRTLVDVAATLAALEARGLVASDEHAWWPSHDLLSESFVEQLSIEQRAEITRALAEAILAEMPEDEVSYVRAAGLFLEAGADQHTARAFVAWVRLRRAREDHRSVRALANSFSPHMSARRDLWRVVPLSLRFPRWRAASLATAVAVFAAFGVVRALTTAAPPPDATLAAWYDSAGVAWQQAVPVNRSAIATSDLVEISSGRRSAVTAVPAAGRAMVSPDGRYLASDRIFLDSGGIDAYIEDKRGHLVARVSSSHDDFSPDWSPDGKRLAFVTGRFNPNRWSDIAEYDIASGGVRPLTRGDDIDVYPKWSPLGTSIAFTRRLHDGSAQQACEMDADGGNLHCASFSGLTDVTIVGWNDERRVIIAAKRMHPEKASQQQVLRIMDIRDTSTARTIMQGAVIQAPSLSPDGRWIACACQVTSSGILRWYVFPVDDPELRAEVVRDRLNTSTFTVGWLGRPRGKTYIDRIEVDSGAGVRPVNAALRLQATAYRADGRRIQDVQVQWSIVSGDAARLEGDLLVPEKAGVVRVRASAGGWAAAEADLRIDQPVTQQLASWDWSEPLDRGWISYGSPSPAVEQDSQLGRAVLPNGDRSFASGIVSRRIFDAEVGLSLTMPVSARIDLIQWQYLSVGFIEEPEGAPATPTFSDASPPGHGSRTCDLAIPRSEGALNRQHASVQSQQASVSGKLPLAAQTGFPMSVTLQLFPDGSCGAAIDGRVVGHAMAQGLPFKRARIAIYGQSANTRIAVGRVEVKSGTDPGVDWREPTSKSLRRR